MLWFSKGNLFCLASSFRRILQPAKSPTRLLKPAGLRKGIELNCRTFSNMADIMKVTADKKDPPFGKAYDDHMADIASVKFIQ